MPCFFPWLLKLEQIPDSQMFVKVYPQHLTLAFSDRHQGRSDGTSQNHITFYSI